MGSKENREQELIGDLTPYTENGQKPSSLCPARNAIQFSKNRELTTLLKPPRSGLVQLADILMIFEHIIKNQWKYWI